MIHKLIFASILLFGLSMAAPAWSTVSKGDRPAVSLPDLDGNIITLDAYQGSVVLIDFWATWCAPCHRAFPFYAEMLEKYGDEGFVVLAISIDRNKDHILKFLRQHGLTITVLHDADQKAFGAFNPPSMPTGYFIARDGTVSDIHVGFRDEDRADIETTIRQLINQPGKTGQSKTRAKK